MFCFILVLTRACLIVSNVVQVCINPQLKQSSLKASLNLPLSLVTMTSIFFFLHWRQIILGSPNWPLPRQPIFYPLSPKQASTTNPKAYWQVLMSIFSCYSNCFTSLCTVSPEIPCLTSDSSQTPRNVYLSPRASAHPFP